MVVYPESHLEKDWPSKRSNGSSDKGGGRGGGGGQGGKTHIATTSTGPIAPVHGYSCILHPWHGPCNGGGHRGLGHSRV